MKLASRDATEEGRKIARPYPSIEERTVRRWPVCLFLLDLGNVDLRKVILGTTIDAGLKELPWPSRSMSIFRSIHY